MAESSFPIMRLATLLARQISSPIANKIKTYAVTHPWFRRTVVRGTGRLYHVVQLRTRMWMLALRQPKELPPISDHEALESGAQLLGEAVLFALGSVIIIFEVNRQANKQEDKELDVQSRWLAILLSLEELKRELELQQQDMDRLEGVLRQLAPSHYRDKPPAPAPAPATTAPPAPPPEH